MRFVWIFGELMCDASLETMKETIFDWMYGINERLIGIGLLDLKGGSPDYEVVRACCNAFACYIYTMIPYRMD